MTAICKTIEIHGALSHLLDYGADTDKTSLNNHAGLRQKSSQDNS